jgi:hypothetical protein
MWKRSLRAFFHDFRCIMFNDPHAYVPSVVLPITLHTPITCQIWWHNWKALMKWVTSICNIIIFHWVCYVMQMHHMCDHLTSPVSRMSRITVATCVATLHVTSGVSEMSHDLVQAPYRAITACNQGVWGLFDFWCMQYMLHDLGI